MRQAGVMFALQISLIPCRKSDDAQVDFAFLILSPLFTRCRRFNIKDVGRKINLIYLPRDYLL